MITPITGTRARNGHEAVLLAAYVGNTSAVRFRYRALWLGIGQASSLVVRSNLLDIEVGGRTPSRASAVYLAQERIVPIQNPLPPFQDTLNNGRRIGDYILTEQTRGYDPLKVQTYLGVVCRLDGDQPSLQVYSLAGGEVSQGLMETIRSAVPAQPK